LQRTAGGGQRGKHTNRQGPEGISAVPGYSCEPICAVTSAGARSGRDCRGRMRGPVRQPDAGRPPVRFDERHVETEPRSNHKGTARRKGWKHRCLTYRSRATSRPYEKGLSRTAVEVPGRAESTTLAYSSRQRRAGSGLAASWFDAPAIALLRDPSATAKLDMLSMPLTVACGRFVPTRRRRASKEETPKCHHHPPLLRTFGFAGPEH
jgi:hypothetical protein